MKKINKSQKIAQQYFHWIKSLEANGTDVEYDSSKNKFYLDVLVNLIVVQNGLCAYTEERLVQEDKIESLKNSFVNGKFIGTKPESSFEIEHFDASIKKTKGWSWENLFAVQDSINTKVKKGQNTYDILKPDTKKYDPLKFLDYDEKMHLFIPKENLSNRQKHQVREMILILGLNWGQTKMRREAFINQQYMRRE